MSTIQQLFDQRLEPTLIAWIARFHDPVELLSNIETLFTTLRTSRISGQAAPGAVINGPVHIGSGTNIHSHVVIDGPVIIAENATVHPHAYIGQYTYIGSSSVVGQGAAVERSLCLNGCAIQKGAFVGDSVLGMYSHVGYGAVFENRDSAQDGVRYLNDDGELTSSGRHLLGAVIGKNASIGAKAVLSPGTLLGENTSVSPGCIVRGRYGSDLLLVHHPNELIVRRKNDPP